MFLFSSCSNISTGTDTDTGKSVAQGTQVATGSEKYMDKAGIEFTGNPAYDIGLLNEWWAKNGTPFPAPGEESSVTLSDSSARSGGFGDLVLNFTVGGALEWAGGTIASGAAGAVVGAGVSAVLNAMGIVRSATSYLNEICERLDRMQGQLNSIQEMLNDTAKEVEEILKDVQKAGDLARYRTVMNNRDERYTEAFISVMDGWNEVNDVLLEAAVSSQYGKNTKAYKAKLDELNTRKLRLEYIGQFIDRDSLLKADNAAGVSFKQTQAAQAFVDYLAKHSEEISAELHKAVIKWGKGELGAARFLSLCSYLTHPDPKDPNLNMFQLYDKYAEASFVWESEGYTFRQQMRDQDSMLIALAAPLVYWYYAITESLGTSSVNCIRLTQYVDETLKLNKDNPVIKKDKQYYQKWGSEWKGQTFTGVIKENDYVKCMNNYWCNAKGTNYKWTWAYDLDDYPDNLRFALNENNFLVRGNSSYLYSCNSPPSSATSSICTAAQNMAMPSGWYKEVFEAYFVDSKPRKTLLEIFRDLGFNYANGVPIQISGYYKPDLDEMYFVISDSKFCKTLQRYERRIDNYKVGLCDLYVPSVMANSMMGVNYMNNEVKSENWSKILTFEEMAEKDSQRYDIYKVPLCVTTSYNNIRRFYYPEKQ